jgi:hypothetical protein
MRTLKLSQLIAAKACQSQVDKFRARFGESVEVTRELCESVASEFDFDWAAANLLSAPARAEYERVTAPAQADYERVTAPAWAEYARVRAPARAEYERVRAAAFADAYINDKEPKP